MASEFKKIVRALFSSSDKNLIREKEENLRRVVEDERERRKRPRGLPYYINIETTRQCNLTCRMCPFHSSAESRKKWGVASGRMDEEVFRGIAKQIFPFLKTCALSVTGEFTLTEYLPTVFELLEKYSVKFDGFTNAMELTAEVSRMMMPHLECLTVSVDSPDPNIYEFIRRGAKWSKLVENVRALMSARESIRPNPRPRLDMQAVLMLATIETLPALVRLAKDMGFDLIKGVHLGVFSEDMVNESLLRHRELYNQKREEALAVAREVGIEILLPPPLKERTVSLEQKGTPPQMGCEFLWRRSFINYDGTVFACCHPNPPLVGNLTGATFEQIWRGFAYSELRRRIFTDNPHPSCAKCWIRAGNIPEGQEEEYLFQF